MAAIAAGRLSDAISWHRVFVRDSSRHVIVRADAAASGCPSVRLETRLAPRRGMPRIGRTECLLAYGRSLLSVGRWNEGDHTARTPHSTPSHKPRFLRFKNRCR